MMLKGIFALPATMLLMLLLAANFPDKHTIQFFTLSGQAQGTTFIIQYTAVHPMISHDEIRQLLNQLDSSLSQYKTYSLINQFNTSATGILADAHLINVVNKALQISRASDGAFDITVKPLLSLWGFNTTALKKIPSSDRIRQTMSAVGYQKILIKDSMLTKTIPSLAIDCDGIAQGYSVDKIGELLQMKGIHHYQIELGGEVLVKGVALNNQPWNTSIDMLNGQHQQQEKILHLNDEAVTTAGSFSKFSKLGGKYFGHIINPRNGKPIDNGMISATVICEDAMTADALDNAFMVMGYKQAMNYVRDKTKMGLYITYRTPDGSLKDTANAYFLKKISPFPAASPHWQ